MVSTAATFEKHTSLSFSALIYNLQYLKNPAQVLKVDGRYVIYSGSICKDKIIIG